MISKELLEYISKPMPTTKQMWKEQSNYRRTAIRSVKPTTPVVVVYGGLPGRSGLVG